MPYQKIIVLLHRNQDFSAMATFELRLSSKAQPGTGRSEVLIRLRHGNLDLYGKSGCYVSPDNFHYYINTRKCERKGIRVPSQLQRLNRRDAERRGLYILEKGEIIVRGAYGGEDWQHDKETKEEVEKIVHGLAEAFEGEYDKSILNSEWMAQHIDRIRFPEKYVAAATPQVSIYEHAARFLTVREIEPSTFRGYCVTFRTMYRFEKFCRATDTPNFDWLGEDINKDVMEDFKDYLRRESDIAEEYPTLYKGIVTSMHDELPETLCMSRRADKISNKGDNTVKKTLRSICTFFGWCREEGVMSTQPFDGVVIGETKYGTPFYLSIEERNQVAEFDLSDRPQLAVQRDIFVFQCMIGARVGDLLRLTPANIHESVLEYVPIKTRNQREQVEPRVPLNQQAMAIVERYAEAMRDGRLLPFISEQKYNDAIKEILQVVGITRQVPIRDSHSGETVMRPIWQVASSHMARRTFVGAAYTKVKDPNLIGKMSGHKEGSKAFNRYRDIADNDLREVTNAIE